MSTKYIPIRISDGYYGPTQFMEVSPAFAGLLASLPPWPKGFKKGERDRWLAAFRIIFEQDYSAPEETKRTACNGTFSRNLIDPSAICVVCGFPACAHQEQNS